MTDIIFIVMTTMITSLKMTLFEIMITNEKLTNKQTNKQIYCEDECYLYCNDHYDH